MCFRRPSRDRTRRLCTASNIRDFETLLLDDCFDILSIIVVD